MVSWCIRLILHQYPCWFESPVLFRSLASSNTCFYQIWGTPVPLKMWHATGVECLDPKMSPSVCTHFVCCSTDLPLLRRKEWAGTTNGFDAVKAPPSGQWFSTKTEFNQVSRKLFYSCRDINGWFWQITMKRFSKWPLPNLQCRCFWWRLGSCWGVHTGTSSWHICHGALTLHVQCLLFYISNF